MSLGVKFNFFLFLLIFPKCCELANILYIISYPGKSQYIVLKPIAMELARRGHNVTVITPFKEPDHPPNYHQVMIDNKTTFDLLGEDIPNLFSTVLSIESGYKFLWRGGLAVTESILNSTQVQEFLAKYNKFDLVVSLVFNQEALFMLAHKYKAPLVLINPIGNSMRHNMLTRNPLQLANIVFDYADIENPKCVFGRFRNLYYTLYEYFGWMYWHLEKQEELVKKYLPDLPAPVPRLYEIQRDASLVLSNSHFSFDSPVTYLPNIVEISGIHLNQVDSKPLPEDLQNILNDAHYGFVYVSFGTNLRSSDLPKDKRDALLKIFGRLKQKVLWKWEDDNLKNQPGNVVTRKWFQQKEILSHPNIKLFISHGGTIGAQEAIYSGVPMLGIPIFADQFKNMQKLQQIGCGKTLRFHVLTAETFERYLNEMLNNDTYKQKAIDLSKAFKDRPMNALDTAVYWIEYVIRNKGAVYMKNPARNLSWFAYNMLDIYAFSIFVLIIVVIIFVKFLTLLKNLLFVKNVVQKEKCN